MSGVIDEAVADEADESGEQDAGEEAAFGGGWDETTVEGFEDEEESEPAHEAAGGTDGGGLDEASGGLAADGCGEEEDEWEVRPASKDFHAFAEVGKGGRVHEEMDDVAMEEGSGEKAPPLAMEVLIFDETGGGGAIPVVEEGHPGSPSSGFHMGKDLG